MSKQSILKINSKMKKMFMCHSFTPKTTQCMHWKHFDIPGNLLRTESYIHKLNKHFHSSLEQ